MGSSPLKNELQNNYAVVAPPQPLLAGVRCYSGDCGGNATKAALQDRGGNKTPGRAARGFVCVEAAPSSSIFRDDRSRRQAVELVAEPGLGLMFGKVMTHERVGE